MKRIQYFFVSCSLQDMINIHRLRGKDLATVHESFAIQLNDTHPSIAVAELMRLLVDEHLMDWVQPISQASRTSTRKPYGRSPFRQRESKVLPAQQASDPAIVTPDNEQR